jgi:hypothetical protein
MFGITIALNYSFVRDLSITKREYSRKASGNSFNDLRSRSHDAARDLARAVMEDCMDADEGAKRGMSKIVRS